MIDYQTFQQIRQLRDQEHLSAAQIAETLHLDERTVGKWIERPTYGSSAKFVPNIVEIGLAKI